MDFGNKKDKVETTKEKEYEKETAETEAEENEHQAEGGEQGDIGRSSDSA